MPESQLPPDGLVDGAPAPEPEVPHVEEPGAAVLAEESPGSRQRLSHTLRHPSRSQVVVAVLLALVGFGAIVQIQATEDDSTYAGLREQDLIDVLNGLSGTTQRTQAEIDRLAATRAELLQESSRREAALDLAQKDLDSLEVLAGLVPVTGPGIRVTITEETGTVDVSSFLDTIQELRSTGAEAIQVNGQVRIVAQSSIDQPADGVGLLIDGTVVQSPYVIDAIGLSSTLAGAINFFFGPRASLEEDGAVVEVVELASLDIEAVRKPVQPQVAQPAP